VNIKEFIEGSIDGVGTEKDMEAAVGAGRPSRIRFTQCGLVVRALPVTFLFRLMRALHLTRREVRQGGRNRTKVLHIHLTESVLCSTLVIKGSA